MVRNIGVATVCVSLLLGPSNAFARGRTKSKEKSEPVGSYTRKGGKTVRSYKRRPPDTKPEKRKRTR